MKKLLLLLLAFYCLILPAQAAGFYDLPADHWASDPIQRAVDAGVVNGYSDGSFQPGRDVTAAQFCAMLSRSFMAEEFAAAAEGKYQAMDACLPILAGTKAEASYKAALKNWNRFVDQPLSRYDMAQIVYNLVSQKGEGPDEEAVRAAQMEIADWDAIPESYRSAVSSCWALGVLQGKSGGNFSGTDSLNRAQACVIWSRLNTLLNGEVPEEVQEKITAAEMPEFVLHEDETVEEMMRRINRATPRCEKDCLPNGKPRTDENIRELLELVKAGCPDGTVWSGTMRFDYKSRLGPTRGPMSFGMAVTDFVFGEEAPVLVRRTLRSLAPGDLIHIRGGGAERVLILITVDYDEDWYTACELKLNGKVDWDEWGPLSGFVDNWNFTTVYRRWQ